MSKNIQASEDAIYHTIRFLKYHRYLTSPSYLCEWITVNHLKYLLITWGSAPKVCVKGVCTKLPLFLRRQIWHFFVCFVFLKKWDSFCWSFSQKWRFTSTSSNNTLFSPAYCCSMQLADFSRGLKIKIYINLQLPFFCQVLVTNAAL